MDPDIVEPSKTEEEKDKDYFPQLNETDVRKELQLRVKQHQIRLIKERGYQLTKKDKEFMKMTFLQFDNYIKSFKKETDFWDSLSQVYVLKKTKKYETNYNTRTKFGFGDKIYVKFPMYALDVDKKMIKKEPVSTIDNVIAEINNLNIEKKYEIDEAIRNVLLISILGLSPQALLSVKNKTQEIKIEHFNYVEMSYIPIDHRLASKYRLLSDEEWLDIEEKNNINTKIIPKILMEDMFVRYYGVIPGCIFEVKNKNYIPESMFSQKYANIEYRLVIY